MLALSTVTVIHVLRLPTGALRVSGSAPTSHSCGGTVHPQGTCVSTQR